MKRRISIILVVVLILSLFQIAYADEVKPVLISANIENKPLEISIEEAIKLTLENSSEVWKIDCDILDAKDAVKDQKNSKDDTSSLLDLPLVAVSGALGATKTSYLNMMLVDKGYGVRAAQMQLTLTEYGKEQLIDGLEIGAKSAYYKALLAQKTVEFNETNLIKTKDQLKVIKVKFDNGSATKLEVLQAELAVNKAQMELDNAKDDLALELLSFKNTLGLSFDKEVILTEKVEYIPSEDIDLDMLINQAKEQRMEVLNAKEKLELQKIEHDAYTGYYTSTNSHYKSAVRKLEYAERNVENTYNDIELDVRTKYLELVKAERSLKNMDKTIELSLEAARITSLFYNYGMATALESLDSETALTQAEIGKYQLLVAYNISKMMFENACEIGIPKY